MEARANAKVNLTLRVGAIRPDGFHPLHSLFQSVSLSDRMTLDRADEDGIAAWDGGSVPDGDRNLAWRAVLAVREAVGATQPVALRLEKRIPVAAGLGGGSADAAAALHLARMFYGAEPSLVTELAPDLGSDVPFCTVGGTALVRGRGEIIDVLEPAQGYTLALVTPPVELATGRVYAAWDAMDGPQGLPIAERHVPPTLRSHAPLVNDLYPAAAALAPELDDWRSRLAGLWGRPVAMSGSGPTLFAFFVDDDEAEAAVAAVPPGVRAAHVAVPVVAGWALVDEASPEE